MKLVLHIAKQLPSNVEEITLEDVASYEVTDSKIIVKFNTTSDETFPLVNTEQEQKGEWLQLVTAATRIGLKIEGGKI